jgi:hypothetical protein
VFVPPLPIDLALAADPGHDEHAHDLGVVPDEASGNAGVISSVTPPSPSASLSPSTPNASTIPPKTRVRRLLSLAVDANATAATAPTLSRGDTASWPIIGDVTPGEAGWWRIEATLKTTRHDQPGPTSQPVAVDVHLTDGLVDDWHPR